MTPPVNNGGAPRRRISARIALAATACLAIVGVVGAIAGSAVAENAIILGKSSSKPGPMCGGKKGCKVEGHVTGFQRRLAGVGRVYEAKKDGKIVAWSARLGSPTKPNKVIFGDLTQTDAFGKKATAGIAILKPVKGGKFKLKSRSPIVPMNGFMGRSPVITLEQPLGVRAGDIVALSIPTWLPAYRGGIGKTKAHKNKNSWRGSRASGKCDAEEFLDQSKPQMKVGSKRKYGCLYKGERLFYRAYMVAN